MLGDKRQLLAPWIILIFYAFTCGIVFLSFIVDVPVYLFVEFFENYSLLFYALGLAATVIYDKKLKANDFLLLAGVGVYLFATTFINGGGVGSVVSLVLPLVFLCCFEYSCFDNLLVYITISLGVFMTLVFSFVSEFVFTTYMTWIFENTTNPNTVGYLTVMFFMLWCSFVDVDSKHKKCFFVIFAFICLKCLLEIRARTALISFIAYCVFLIIPKKFVNKKTITALLLAVVAIGFMIPIAYVYFYQSGIELEFFGKNLFTGRELVWQDMLRIFGEKGVIGWLFGAGSHTKVDKGVFGIHNEYFAIVFNFGIFGFLLILLFFITKLKPVLLNVQDGRVRKLTFSFVCVCIACFFETLFISSFLYVFICFGLGFAMNRSRALENQGRFIEEREFADKILGNGKKGRLFAFYKKVKAVFLLLKQKFTPVNKDLIVFTSFNGHYSDSPKYISQKIHEQNENLKIVWIVENKYLNDLPEYVMGVDIKNEKACNRYLGAARVLVDNVYASKETSLNSNGLLAKILYKFLSWLKKKKNQLVFTTWHGTPLKRMGRDQIGNSVYDFACPNTTMILGNQFTLDIMERLTFGKVNMRLLGCPRNDLLFERGKESYYKNKLGLPTDKKVLLFAPTFRNDGKDCDGKNVMRSGINQLNSIDVDKLLSLLSDKFGGEWVLVCRFHYHVEKMVDWSSLNKRYNNRIINGNKFDDMAEYLAASDLLLTDASSSMFDYMHTEKPCMLFFPDVDNYKNKERGFYVEIEELPFSCSVDFDGLMNDIKNFENEKYLEKVNQLKCKFGYVDGINSAEEVAKYIVEETKKS